MLCCSRPTLAGLRSARPCARAAPVRRRSVPLRAQLGNEASSREDLADGLLGPVITSLAALGPLVVATAARADEAAADAAAAGAGGPGAGEVVLLATPLFIYALFNLYRDRVNPQAKFLDYIYIMAFLAIVANLVSIVVFKTRFF